MSLLVEATKAIRGQCTLIGPLKEGEDRRALTDFNIARLVQNSTLIENFFLLGCSQETVLREDRVDFFDHMIRDKKFHNQGGDLHRLLEKDETEEIDGFLNFVQTKLDEKHSEQVEKKQNLIFDLLTTLDPDLNTVLHKALISGSKVDLALKMLEKILYAALLDMLKVQNKEGKTVLHLVIEKGYTDLALKIINKIPEESLVDVLKLQDKGKNTVLNLALTNGLKELASVMVNKTPKSDLKKLLKVRELHGGTVLHSVSPVHEDLVVEIVKKIPRDSLVKLLKIRNVHGNTILQLAMIYELKKLAIAIVNKILVLDSSDAVSPSFIAVMRSSALSILTIQDKDNDNILHLAIKNGYKDLALKMLETIPFATLLDMLKVQNINGKTVLHLVMEKGYKDLALKMLETIPYAALLDMLKVQNIDRKTILHLVIEKGYTDLALKIINKISQRDLVDLLKKKDAFGNTLLHCSLRECLKALSLAMVNKLSEDEDALVEILKIKNRFGETILYTAINVDFEDIAVAIVDKIPQKSLVDIMKIRQGSNNNILLFSAIGRYLKKLPLAIVNKLSEDEAALVEILKMRNTYDDTVLLLLAKYLAPESPADYAQTERLAVAIVNKLSEESLVEILKILAREDNTVLHFALAYKSEKLAIAIVNKLSEDEAALVEILKIRNKFDKTILLILLNRYEDFTELALRILEKIDLSKIESEHDSEDLSKLLALVKDDKKVDEPMPSSFNCKTLTKKALPYVMLSAAIGTGVFLRYLRTNEEE